MLRSPQPQPQSFLWCRRCLDLRGSHLCLESIHGGPGLRPGTLRKRVRALYLQTMNSLISTSRGAVLIREAKPADATRYRELRLNALLDSPTAFSADYQLNLRHPMSFWESRLTSDEYGMMFLAEHENALIGMTGVRK